MSRRPARNASYDYARLLAVIGIIWFHTGAPGAGIGYSGLAFFLMLLMVLALPGVMALRDTPHRAPAILRYAAGRGRRLLVPWLIASLFYGGLKLIDVSQGATFAAEFQTSMWLTGPALHLWFLPFAFAMCLALWPLGRRLRQAPAAVWWYLSLGATAAALIALVAVQDRDLIVPLAQWGYALPAVLMGVALALTRGQAGPMLGLVMLFLCAALGLQATMGLFEITLAGALLILCRVISLPATALSGLAARSSLQIYLIHPAVMALVLRSGLVEAKSLGLAITVTGICLGIVLLWDTMTQVQSTGQTAPS